jgi:hypothetical protein
MSICSGINITRKKAEKILKNMLLFDQEILIDLAIKNMDNLDLASKISDECYDYCIDEEEEFEVGDRVKINKESLFYNFNDELNPSCSGKIIDINTDEEFNIIVQWDNAHINNYNAKDLELV